VASVGTKAAAMVSAIGWLASGCSNGGGEAVERARLAVSADVITVSFQEGTNGYAGTTDGKLVQNARNTNYAATTSLSVDGDDPAWSGRDIAALLRWDVSAIPPGSRIEAASIAIRILDGSANTYPIYALTRAWEEGAATWSLASAGMTWQVAGAQGANDREATSIGAVPAYATGTAMISLEAAALAKIEQWVADPPGNFGIVIAHASNRDLLTFSSSEASMTSTRPKLTVSYRPPPPDAGTPLDAASSFDAAADVVAAPDGARWPDVGSPPDLGSLPDVGSPPDSPPDLGSPADAAPPLDAAGPPDAGPIPSPPPPAVLYAVGDVGDCNKETDTATGLLLDGSPDPIALLGDIAYPNGSAANFSDCFHPVWGRHRPRIRPSPGNHEYVTPGAAGYYAYFGAAAGDPTKGYYSYDLGGWHIVSLNSNCSDVSCAAGGAQERWLRQDLAANPRLCTMAYWHHPRFNSGSHGNSTNVTPLYQALLDHGADLVLNGHEHGYQRWVAMDASGAAVPNGIVEIVAGTGGTGLVGFSGTKPANTVVRNATTNGVLKLTLRESGYDYEFKPVAGQAFTDLGTANCH
jgi:hypothetical protein